MYPILSAASAFAEQRWRGQELGTGRHRHAGSWVFVLSPWRNLAPDSPPNCETACSSFQSEGAYDVILPRATANSQVMGSANSTLRAEDMYMVQSHQVATPPKDGKISQVFRNPYVWD